MPRSLISDEELHALLASILKPGEAAYAVALLEACHDGFKTVLPLMPYERFFTKALSYRGFHMHVRHFEVLDDTVQLASIQFKRKSRFPAPILNRNRALVREIKRILDSHYAPRTADTVEEERGGQFHYLAKAQRSPSAPWEEWGSECALYDEPHSSGQTPADLTDIRNDFVIFRFKRQRGDKPKG